ncbi:YhcN/YlaJ family sporulation lipoprotein [Thermosyntropha lipolytica]|nr:YhcN/YlaJ family sporulation lipoprotein [Thermosyntropha lipolytica]
MIFVVGCQTTAKKPIEPQSNQGTVPRSQNLSTAPGATVLTDAEAKALAKKLARMADNVAGVQKATVVVTEGTGTTPVANQPRTGVTTINNDRFNGMTNNTGTAPGGRMIAGPTGANTRGIVVMVGLDVDRSMINNTAEMERLKTKVANKLLRADNRISRVYVTTDPELVKRIKNTAADILEGKPLSRMKSDLNELMDRMKGESSAF